jgi:hypothetical protein
VLSVEIVCQSCWDRIPNKSEIRNSIVDIYDDVLHGGSFLEAAQPFSL